MGEVPDTPGLVAAGHSSVACFPAGAFAPMMRAPGLIGPDPHRKGCLVHRFSLISLSAVVLVIPALTGATGASASTVSNSQAHHHRFVRSCAATTAGLAACHAIQNQAVLADGTVAHAATPSGLDAPGQISSPYDLALIARAAMALPDFARYVATKHSSILGPQGRIAISSHDKLLYNYPGAIGIKNGFTVKARASFVGAARRNGHTLVVTLMHTNPRYWPEAAALLDWGFQAERAGVTPIGTLVAPGTTGIRSAPAVPADTGPVQAANGVNSDNPADGTPVLPAAVVGFGLLAVGGGVLRSRRRASGGAPTRRS